MKTKNGWVKSLNSDTYVNYGAPTRNMNVVEIRDSKPPWNKCGILIVVQKRK